METLPWQKVIAHAWSFTYLQIARTFILQRIEPAALRTTPGTDPARAPPPATLATSNAYSPAEATLLAWLEVHTRRMLPQQPRRLLNFSASLADCVALCAAVASHWPEAARLLPQLSGKPGGGGGGGSGVGYGAASGGSGSGGSGAFFDTEGGYRGNAEVLLAMLDAVRCPMVPTMEQLLAADAVELLFFVAFLFTWLPQLVPRATVEFEGKLQEAQTKCVELSNSERRPLSYAARLHGHADFTLDAQSVRIEPGGTASVAVVCRPSTGVTQTASLILTSRKDGGAVGAMLVFQLVSNVRHIRISFREHLDALQHMQWT